MKNIKKQTGLLFAVLLLLPLLSGLFVMTPKVSAATITVTTTDSEDDDPGPGAGCSLFEAITAANTDAAYGGCAAGNGLDTINVPAGTYDLAGLDYTLTEEATVLGASNGNTILANNVFSVNNTLGNQTYLFRDITFRDSVSQGFSFVGNGSDNYSVTLDRITVEDSVGIGVYHQRDVGGSGQMYITNSLIQNNQSNGLYNNECNAPGSVHITNTMIRGNQAGGINNSCGSIHLNRVTIYDNTSSGLGAGVYSPDELEMINVTIFGNTSTDNVGGVYAGGTASLRNVTIAHNSATEETGGIAGVGTLNIINTLVANNNGRQCADGTETTINGGSNNMASDDSCSDQGTNYFTNIGDAKLASNLADNGGEAPVGSGGLGGNVLTLALLEGSPAINTGDNDNCPEIDERDAGRPFGASCDVGAFEAHYASVVTDSPTPTPATTLADTGQNTFITTLGGMLLLGLSVFTGRFAYHKVRRV